MYGLDKIKCLFDGCYTSRVANTPARILTERWLGYSEIKQVMERESRFEGFRGFG